MILLDVRLPGIDGFEVCRRLKADERTRESPVIFMTVAAKTEDKVRGFEAGGVDYITKPLQQEEVLARVVTHLRIRELTRRLEEANESLEEAKESLERRVGARTAALAQTNQELQAEIAERRRAEEALRRCETLLNATQRLAKVGGWDWDIERETTFWTEETYRIHGFEPQASVPGASDYIDRSLTCYNPNDRPIVSAAFER
jgi:DNA-binding response OmpR family regulator